ncbi:MAG: hypothetical protein Q4C54_03295 [Clostridia bacterium]|nr:hypothetical protein [Clostridia bacterium]
MLKQSKGIVRVLLCSAAVLCAGVLLAFFAVSLFSYSSVTLTGWYETIKIKPAPWYMVILAAVLLQVLMAALRLLKKVKNRTLFMVLGLLYAVLGATLVLAADDKLRADALLVLTGAWDVNAGIYKNFEPGGYFFQYPHQLGTVTFERILTGLVPTIRVLYGANLLCILATNALLWQMTDILCGRESTASRAVILLSFLFAPSLFFILFLYGLVPGMCLTAAGFYCWIKTEQSEKPVLWWVGCIAAMTLAVLLRKNCLIAVVAVVILTLVRILRDRQWKPLIALLALMVCVTQATPLLVKYYEHETGMTLGKGFPTSYWMAMGLQDNQREKFGRRGWFNGYDGVLIGKCDKDYEAMDEMAKKNIAKNLEYMARYPDRAAAFFGYKLVTMWCDPLCESIVSGPQTECGQSLSNPVWQSIYDGKGAHGAILAFSHGLMALVFLFAGLGAVKFIISKNGDVRPLIFGVYFLGGVLFHLVWEAKSQYAYPYMVLLLPLAAMGMAWVRDSIKGKHTKESNEENK